MKFTSQRLCVSVNCALLLTTLFIPMPVNSADVPVHIKYVYYSGVLPRDVETHVCELDSQTMRAADAAELEMLIENSKIFDKGTENDFDQTEGGPGYVIECRKGTSATKVEWSYRHAPERIWPLVKFLEKRSRIIKR